MTENEENYDWRVGPCAGMTWSEWCDVQAEISGFPTSQQLSEIEVKGDNAADQDEEEADQDEEEADQDEEEADQDEDDDQDEEEADQDEDDDQEIECPHAPRAALRSVRRLSFGTFVKEKSIHHNAIQIPKTPESAVRVAQCPDAPKKAKTRAEKRAADPESDTGDSDFVTPKKKERRTAYWAFHDDLRIKQAKRERALNSEDFTSGGAYQCEPVSFGKGWNLAEELLLST